MMNISYPTWSSQTKIIVSLLLTAFFVYLLNRFRLIIPPFIIAVIWAYILSPFAHFLQSRLKIPRVLAILLSDIILIATLGALPMLIIPNLGSQFENLDLDLQQYLNKIHQWSNFRLVFGTWVIDISAIIDEILLSLRVLLQPVIGQTLNIALGIITSMIWIVFILVISFYLVKDAESLKQWLERLVPEMYRDDFIRLRDEISDIWAAFFRGQLLLALTVTIIMTIMGLILGLPFAFSMGILAGLLEFLPSIGHGIWLFTASMLALLAGSTWIPLPNWAFTLIVIGSHVTFQQFDINYLIPRIIGKRVHLPPLVVILGIVAGAATAGILGIPLAAPTIASARVIGKYIHAKLFDLPPFLTEITSTLPPPNPQWWRRTSLPIQESSRNEGGTHPA